MPSPLIGPIDRPRLNSQPPVGPADTPALAPYRATVLVVDDNPLNAKLLRLAHEAQGYRVVVAESAATAWTLIAAATPDIVLLDVQMPGIDGLTLLRSIRADAAVANLSVIIVSAFAGADDLEAAYTAGADAFIPKPVPMRTMRTVVDRLIATHPSRVGSSVSA